MCHHAVQCYNYELLYLRYFLAIDKNIALVYCRKNSGVNETVKNLIICLF